MSARVLWYWNRLCCMTPAEMAHRAREAVRLQWSARFLSAPRGAAVADAAAQGRPWFAGDVADVQGLRRAADEIVQGRLEVLGLGVVPMGPQVRAFVDALGRLNQQVAAQCERVTWMVAGLPVVVKGAA